MEYKTDPYTKELFIPRRKNQVFASKANKIRFNNEKAARRNAVKTEVIKILDKNWRILHKLLNGREEATVPAQLIKQQGFSVAHMSHLVREPRGVMHCIFDVGYIKMDNGTLIIRTHD